MLSVESLDAFYGPVQILHGIDLAVDTGQIVALVGANAAGKSTLMFSLAGLRTVCKGRISIGRERIEALPAYERVMRGLVLVPERRRLLRDIRRAGSVATTCEDCRGTASVRSAAAKSRGRCGRRSWRRRTPSGCGG